MPETGPPVGRKSPKKYYHLLVSIAFLICLFPFVHEFPMGTVILQAVFLAVMAAAILAARRSGRHLALALGLGLSAIAARLAAIFATTPPRFVSLLLAAVTLAFFFWVLVVLTIDVFASGTVSRDRICGAICVYLIIGITWSILFSFLELAQPGSFVISGVKQPEIQAGLDASRADEEGFGAIGPYHLHTMEGSYLTYLSFVTLTSVGYGDVVPVSHAARTFAWLEAVVGQLYLAILVARLVGMHIVKHSQEGT